MVLTELDLECFKCFESLRLPLRSLTLLSGSNASGKSSILQALVLLHQTMREHEWSTRLMLNGSAINLGTVSDVVDKIYGRRSFEIGIIDQAHSYRWAFAGEREEMSMRVESVAVDRAISNMPDSLRYLLPNETGIETGSLASRLRDLTYITAERVGPREVYALEDRQTASVVGSTGAFAASVLHWGREEQVIGKLVVPGSPPNRWHQVQERMRQFFPGCSLDVQPVPKANAVTVGLRTTDDTSYHRPIHVGFGLTQIFPVVVAGLSASEDGILLIENPEVHLHPAGQALMGQFLGEIAAAGIQVIAESHSDHILNGIRRAVKSGGLKADEVAIHYFRQRSAEVAQVVSPQMDRSGIIDSWPDGFFDQFDKDSSYFAGWGR